MNKIAHIRKEYQLKEFSETAALPNGINQFDAWWKEAQASEIDEINAFTLCTASLTGKPSGRILLLKGYDNDGFIFFTNYQSRKGQELYNNPFASMVFFWKELERQVRIEGRIEKISNAESDEYFLSRPPSSQVGAWASPQSQVITSRQVIENNLQQYQVQFGTKALYRPPHWGGYRLKPAEIEFWQGRPSRLHDRLRYTLQPPNTWLIERLAP
jgi:pyridoxamine 5'-phosphate oxidase